MPREFRQIFVTVLYIHPKANYNKDVDTIYDLTTRLESNAPDAPKQILGDFNACNLKKTLPNYEQYVTCETRKQKTIDLCYGNIKSGYTSYVKPPLGESDHNTILLVP